jgi:hypothetical protein
MITSPKLIGKSGNFRKMSPLNLNDNNPIIHNRYLLPINRSIDPMSQRRSPQRKSPQKSKPLKTFIRKTVSRVRNAMKKSPKKQLKTPPKIKKSKRRGKSPSPLKI